MYIVEHICSYSVEYNLRESIYIERQGGREIESPLVMELLSTNDSSFTGFHLLFSIIWKLEWRPGPSFVSQGKMVFVPTAEVSPLPHVCIWSKVHHKTVLPSSQEDYWCKNSKFAVSSDSLPIRSSTPFLSSLCHPPPSSPPL